MSDDTSADDARWKRVDELFERALELPPGERAGFLDAACDDPEVRAEIDSLLASAEDVGDFLQGRTVIEEAMARVADDETASDVGHDDATDRIGTILGPWRIVERIGRGGMATVYRAERVEGGFEQEVALKVIRRGLDTEDVIRRFEGERQILSSLQHPGVAGLLDGGVTPDGLPYLVMDLVDGVHVTRYCDDHRLGIEARLRLFVRIAEVIGFAHRKLVVHRDLKPSNILVASDGRPVLLDFGIAKLLDDDPEEGLTRTGARWITPGYAAPEQIVGAPASTATDVYQLGVLLFELLTGERPFPTRGRSTFELEKAICKEPPPRPSSVGTQPSAATTRGTDPSTLRRRLSGDLDAIVLKALRKEPDERYASVDAMARDVERHLERLPVEATRGGTAYRARKFLRRNPGAVAAAAAFILLLVGWAGSVTVQSSRIAAERDRAELETDKATEVTTFLSDLLGSADPLEARGEDVTVEEVLEEGVRRIGSDLGEQPDVQAELYLTTGNVYRRLGTLETADSLLQRAVEIRRDLYGEGPHDELAEAEMALGELRLEMGELEEGEALMRSALDQRRILHPEGDRELADALVGLGEAQRMLDRMDQAEETFLTAIGIFEAIEPSPPVVDLGVTRNNLGLVYHSTGRLAEAWPLYQVATEAVVDSLGPDHPWSLSLVYNLGAFDQSIGRFAEADSLMRIVVEGDRNVAPESPNTATSIAFLGQIHSDMGDYASADTLIAEALDLLAFLGETHPAVIQRLSNLSYVRLGQGRLDEAVAMADDVVARSAERNEGPPAAYTRLSQAQIYKGAERFEEALDLLEAMRADRAPDAEPDRSLARIVGEMAAVHRAAGDGEAAARRLDESITILRALPRQGPALARALARAAELSREAGEFGEAAAALDEAEAIIERDLPPGSTYAADVDLQRARLYLATGDLPAAREALAPARAYAERNHSPGHPLHREIADIEAAIAAAG